MDNRCRGANGEVRGEAGDEYPLFNDFPKELRRFRGRKGGILRNWRTALESLMRRIEEWTEADTSQKLQKDDKCYSTAPQ